MVTKKIQELSRQYIEEMTKIRHAIHMYPEIGFELPRTAKIVTDTLDKLHIPYTAGIAQSGILATIKGNEEGKTVLLRADMDALQMEEKADVAYKSQRPGYMHACGHDGHTASLLGAAMILNDLKDHLKGTVKLMFQPAEETDGGAEPMIQEGILENPKVDAAFACHIDGTLPEGMVQTKPGPLLASPDEFYFKVTGKGGHAASPHLSIDPVVITALIIQAIQTISSRCIDPCEPAVITCSSIHGGTVHNIIPDYVEVVGTIRTFDEALREQIPKDMENIIKGITSSYQAQYDFRVIKRFPPLINHPETTALALNSMRKILGDQNVTIAKYPTMGAEDFAYVCKKVPSTFFSVGVQKDKETSILHNPHLQWDDKNMLTSSQCMAQIAIDYLNS